MNIPSILKRGLVLLPGVLIAGMVCAASLDADILKLQQDWAVTNYRTPAGDAKVKAFDALAQRAAAVSAQYPQRAEPLV